MDKVRYIHRAPEAGNWFPYYRPTAQNASLSYGALGLLTYLLSLPDDWRVIPDRLERPGAGRDKIHALMRELMEAKHLQRQKVVKSGKFAGVHYMVYDRPYDAPAPVKAKATSARKAKAPAAPHAPQLADQAIKNAIAGICFGKSQIETAWETENVSLMSTLKKLIKADPELSVDGLKDFCLWYRTPDKRGFVKDWPSVYALNTWYLKWLRAQTEGEAEPSARVYYHPNIPGLIISQEEYYQLAEGGDHDTK
jgi:hypothetical protein